MNPTMLRLSVMMFLQFFIWGAWYVTVGNYMKSHGMFDQVAWAYTVGPIAAIVSPFFLGIVADRFFATERVLGVLHLLGAVSIVAAPFAAAINPTLFIGMLLIHMLCYMPTLGLTNTLAFSHLDNQEQLPYVRVWGTIGWIAANWVVSKGFKADFTETQFYVTGVAAAALGLFSFVLPHTPPPSRGKKPSVGDILGLDALGMLKQPSFAVFVLCSFLLCIPLAAYYAFAPVFAGKVLPNSETVAQIASATGGWLDFTDIAFTMSFGQISEIVFMVLMPWFLLRLGLKWTLLIGMAAWVVRYALFGQAHNGDIMWMVLVGILLHGICYDFFFVSGFIYTDKKAPREIRGQAQGFLVLVTQGLGLGLGAQIMGWLVGRYTPPEAQELQAQSAELSREAFQISASDPARSKELADQAAALGGQAAELMQWDYIWYLPAIAAGVVLIIFLLAFRDETASAQQVTEGDVASAAMEDELP